MFLRQNQRPPCEGCPHRRPSLLAENREVWQLWSYCNGQVRTAGLGSVVGIDYNAMFKVADLLGIDMIPAVLAKVQALEEVLRKKVNKDGKRKSG